MSVTLSALPRPATSLVRMLVGEVKVIGSLPEGPVLLCGNHVSYRDVFLFAVVRPSSRLLVHPLVFSFPFLKKWALRRGFVQVSIEDAVALLKHGQTVAICPSGNVEVLGEAERPFKTGAVRIAAQAGALSATITANVRFCRSQLRLGDFEPTHVYIAGAGAMGHGYLKALGERSRLIVRLLNPFAGHMSRLSTELSDRLASLPNAWCPVIGGASAATWELDALADERLARQRYWRSEGALKAAAVAALLLTGLGIVRTEAA